MTFIVESADSHPGRWIWSTARRISGGYHIILYYLLNSRQVRNGIGAGRDAMGGDGDMADSAADGGKINKETPAHAANRGNPENPATVTATNPTRPNPAGAGHSDDDSGCALEEYTWVPPGLKPDQVGMDKRDGCLSLVTPHAAQILGVRFHEGCVR